MESSPKSLCKNLINSFDKKMELMKEKGERANKRNHSSENRIIQGKIIGMIMIN